MKGIEVPKTIQENGFEIRTFMPKWGIINERRGQLHEVIRLSGMNLIIDDTDHPLIIKVASVPQARVQVYFIDNDDFFMKRQMAVDEEGNEYNDNGERAIFFARGVLETVKSYVGHQILFIVKVGCRQLFHSISRQLITMNHRLRTLKSLLLCSTIDYNQILKITLKTA